MNDQTANYFAEYTPNVTLDAAMNFRYVMFGVAALMLIIVISGVKNR